MKKFRVVLLMVCWGWPSAFFSSSVFATTTAQNTIRVIGSGEVTAVPDKLSFNILLRKQDRLVSKLYASVEQSSGLIISYLRSQKIPDQNIQSMAIQVTPWIEYETQRRVQKGFELSRIISVTLNDGERLGTVLDHLFRIDNVEISGVDLIVANRQKYYNQAMQLAIEAAKAKALLVANSLSVDLGAAVAFNEVSAQTFPRQESLMRTADTNNTFLPGQVSVVASVEVEFSIR